MEVGDTFLPRVRFICEFFLPHLEDFRFIVFDWRDFTSVVSCIVR